MAQCRLHSKFVPGSTVRAYYRTPGSTQPGGRVLAEATADDSGGVVLGGLGQAIYVVGQGFQQDPLIVEACAEPYREETLTVRRERRLCYAASSRTSISVILQIAATSTTSAPCRWAEDARSNSPAWMSSPASCWSESGPMASRSPRTAPSIT